VSHPNPARRPKQPSLWPRSPITSSTARTAGYLRQFYDTAPGLQPPPRPLTWQEMGGQLKRLYETLLERRV
jgi:hypothetical protein